MASLEEAFILVPFKIPTLNHHQKLAVGEKALRDDPNNGCEGDEIWCRLTQNYLTSLHVSQRVGAKGVLI